jgi:hypothetical protein
MPVYGLPLMWTGTVNLGCGRRGRYRPRHHHRRTEQWHSAAHFTNRELGTKNARHVFDLMSLQ